MLLPFSSGKRKLENESLHPETKPYVSISFEGLTLGYPGHIKACSIKGMDIFKCRFGIARAQCVHPSALRLRCGSLDVSTPKWQQPD